MWAFRSKTPGIGGRIKDAPEDFVVEEIAKEGEAGGGAFTRFILRKRGWNTEEALGEIADRLGVSRKRFSCAGTKDRVAVTTQLCSCWGIEPQRLLSLHIKDIEIAGAWKGGEVRMGDLLGNRFRITVRGVAEGALGKIERISGELGGLFPNYFGEQRFGALRGNTHLVGRELVRGNLRGAVLNYLCFQGGMEGGEAAEARRRLAEEMDFKRALSYFPAHLKYERALLARLAKDPRDWAGSLRALPRKLLLMFVHAYQAWLFNCLLSERVREGHIEREGGEYLCGRNALGFPEIGRKVARGGFLVGKVIGFETKVNERERMLLEKEEVDTGDFRLRSLPEVGSRGARRVLLAPFKEFEAKEWDGAVAFSFSLPAGCYATALLREYMSEEKG